MIKEVPLVFVLFMTSLLQANAQENSIFPTNDVPNTVEMQSMQDSFKLIGQALTDALTGTGMQEKVGDIGESIQESVSSPETQEKIGQIGRMIQEQLASPETQERMDLFASSFAEMMAEAFALMYVSGQKNAELPPLTEADLLTIKAVLPSHLAQNVKLIKEIPDAFDITAKTDNAEIRITRHIGMNMATVKAMKDSKKEIDNAQNKVSIQTLSDENIEVKNFQKEKVGDFSTIYAPTKDGKLFYITNAGTFIAIQIEAKDKATAKQILTSLSPTALMKAFKTDQSTVTVKQAMDEVEELKKDPAAMEKMGSYMQEMQKKQELLDQENQPVSE